LSRPRRALSRILPLSKKSSLVQAVWIEATEIDGACRLAYLQHPQRIARSLCATPPPSRRVSYAANSTVRRADGRIACPSLSGVHARHRRGEAIVGSADRRVL